VVTQGCGELDGPALGGIGYRSAIACQMAIASYHKRRTVRWDPKTEDIV
jgi:hypothetical protein